jgi:hypothetical protein
VVLGDPASALPILLLSEMTLSVDRVAALQEQIVELVTQFSEPAENTGATAAYRVLFAGYRTPEPHDA